MKKSKKPRKNPPVPLSNFLSQSSNNMLAASKILPDVLVKREKVIALPTAPRASRSMEFEDTITQEPPYVAFINNLPFDAKEQEVRSLFPDFNIKSVRLPREGRSQKRTRGFAYIEFEKREDLISVLHMEEPLLRSRRVRIEVSNDRDGYALHLERMNNASLSECTDPLPLYRFERNCIKDKTLMLSSPRSSGGGGDATENSSESESTFDKEFPELNSTPRKSLKETPSPSGQERSSSPKITASMRRIFGLAKPVDTAKKEAEIEERLNQERQTQQRLQELAAYENANAHYRNFFGEIRPPKLHFFRNI